jgi:BirA family biotin operon repressor/biotin-[acetyl-CoA-carboxylase] ligase
MDEAILNFLRQHTAAPLSGEEMARHLKVSRTTVWKRIKSLEQMGYEIEASTRSGYRLLNSPDLLAPWEVNPLLKTKRLGKVVHYFHAIDSTNAKAYELASKGAQEGEVVVAESQEKGRGRLGRLWFSPPFLNLYVSIILRPDIPPNQASLLTLMAAVATAETLEQFSGLQPIIKWPNDILLRNRKIAGLLNEIHSETDRVHFVILGIGVNLNVDPEKFPREIRSLATSLKHETGKTVLRKVFLSSLLETTEKWYKIFLKEGGLHILKAWKGWAQIQGKKVRVTSFGEVLTGVAIDVDSDGALILGTEDGKRKRVVAGDVEYQVKSHLV